MAMKAADVFEYLKQQNVIRSGKGSDDTSTQSEGYSPPLPPFAEGPKTRYGSDKGRQDHSVEETVLPQTTQGVHIRLQLRDTTTSACRRRGHDGPYLNENANNIQRLWTEEEE